MIGIVLIIVVAILAIWLAMRKIKERRNDPVFTMLKTGRAYEEKGNAREALRHYQIAQHECEKNDGHKGALAQAVFLQGRIHMQYQDFEKAMPLLYLAEELCNEINDVESVAYSCMYIAEALENQEKYMDSDEYFTKAAEIWQNIENTEQYAYTCYRQGKIKAKQKKYQEAIELFERAGKIWERQYSTENLAQMFIETADCKAKMGDIKASKADYREAEKLLRNTGAWDGVKEMEKRINELES